MEALLNVSALEQLVLERSASTLEECDRAGLAIKKASAEFPGYFHEYPTNTIQRLQREIFLFRATIVYLEGQPNHAILDDFKRALVDRQIELRNIPSDPGAKDGNTSTK